MMISSMGCPLKVYGNPAAAGSNRFPRSLDSRLGGGGALSASPRVPLRHRVVRIAAGQKFKRSDVEVVRQIGEGSFGMVYQAGPGPSTSLAQL